METLKSTRLKDEVDTASWFKKRKCHLTLSVLIFSTSSRGSWRFIIYDLCKWFPCDIRVNTLYTFRKKILNIAEHVNLCFSESLKQQLVILAWTGVTLQMKSSQSTRLGTLKCHSLMCGLIDSELHSMVTLQAVTFFNHEPCNHYKSLWNPSLHKDQYWCNRCPNILTAWCVCALVCGCLSPTYHRHLSIKERETCRYSDWLIEFDFIDLKSWDGGTTFSPHDEILFFIFTHTPLHIAASMSHPHSIYSKWAQGRWILMHLRWPPNKHRYSADHVASLTSIWNI